MKEENGQAEKYTAINWDADLRGLVEEFGNCLEEGYAVDLPQFIEDLKIKIVTEVNGRGINQMEAAKALRLNRGTYRKYLKKGAEL